MRAAPLRLSTVVKTLVVEGPTSSGDGWDPLVFRVEIVEVSGDREAFDAHVWRMEHYRLAPSFPGDAPAGRVLADELILVRDTFFDGCVAGVSVAEVQDKVLDRIASIFAGGDLEPGSDCETSAPIEPGPPGLTAPPASTHEAVDGLVGAHHDGRDRSQR